MKKAYYFELRKYAFGCPDCEHINEIDVDPAENGQIICEKCGETFQAEEDKNVIYAEDRTRTMRGIAVGVAISATMMLVCIFIRNIPFQEVVVEIMFKNTNYFSWKCPRCGFLHERYSCTDRCDNIRCVECGTEFDQIEWIENEKIDDPYNGCASDWIAVRLVKWFCIVVVFLMIFKGSFQGGDAVQQDNKKNEIIDVLLDVFMPCV